MELTAAHWVYAAVTIAIIVTMILRRGVVLPTIVGTLLVAWVYKGSLVGAFQAVFNANLVAAKELFNIFLIITLMVGLLNSLRALGADQKMIAPIQKVIKNAHVAILVIFAYNLCDFIVFLANSCSTVNLCFISTSSNTGWFTSNVCGNDHRHRWTRDGIII